MIQPRLGPTNCRPDVDLKRLTLNICLEMHNLNPGANLLPGAKLHPRVNLHPLM